MSALTICRRALTGRLPDQDGILEFLRQELVPVLKELRETVNRFASGPYDMGTILSGNGVPTTVPFGARAIYIRLDGGPGSTLYVFEGFAWAPK